MSNNIIVKNTLYVTSILAAIVLAVTIIFWNQMPMTQRLIGIFYFLIAAHEWEELKFPGGFIETVNWYACKGYEHSQILLISSDDLCAFNTFLYTRCTLAYNRPISIRNYRTNCPSRSC